MYALTCESLKMNAAYRSLLSCLTKLKTRKPVFKFRVLSVWCFVFVAECPMVMTVACCHYSILLNVQPRSTYTKHRTST